MSPKVPPRGPIRDVQWQWLSLLAVGMTLAVIAALAPAGASAASSGALSITTSGLPVGQRPSIVVSGPGFRRVITSDHQILEGVRPGRYLLRVSTVMVGRSAGRVRAGAVAYPSRRRLEVQVKVGRTGRLTVRYAAIINPGVQRLSTIVAGVRGRATDPNAIVLSGKARAPVPGTILTSGPTTMLPLGLISRVMGTKRHDGRLVVSLVAVPVTEAVPQLSFTGSLQLASAADSTQESGSPIPAEAASVRSAHTSASCGPPSLLKFGAHLDSVELRQAFIGAWPPQMKLTLAARTTETLGVGFAAVGINCDWDLAELGPYSAGIPVGPIVVPVYATLPLKASVHINGRLEAGAINVASTTVAHAAAGWDESDASLSEQGSNEWLSGIPSVSGSADLSASIGLQAGIGIARGANLHLEASFGPELDWTTGHNCELFVNMGSLSAGVEALGHSFNTPSFTPFRLHLWSGCQPATGGSGGSGGNSSGGSAGGSSSGGGSSGSGGGPGGSTTGTVAVSPSAIIAGQSIEVHTSRNCPAGSGFLTEILPTGAPIDGASDSQHATWQIVNVTSPGGVYEGVPELLAGEYEVAIECLREDYQEPPPPSEVTFVYERAHLRITEDGRHVSVSPASAPAGTTISVSPDAPCVGTGSGTIELNMDRETIFDRRTEYPLGTVSSKCEWGERKFTLFNIPAGEYEAEVIVEGPGGNDFAYLPTPFRITE